MKKISQRANDVFKTVRQSKKSISFCSIVDYLLIMHNNMVRQSFEARYLILKFLVFETEFQDNGS